MATQKKQNKSAKLKPRLPWQVGEYDRVLAANFVIPYPALLFCRLMDIPPEEIIKDFFTTLSCASLASESGIEAKAILINYFIVLGYGQHFYTAPEIRQVFKEMEAMKMLFPDEGADVLLDLYSAWREEHYPYWFNRWFNRGRRQPIQSLQP